MGHYCKECEEKLFGGIVPTTCECIECYCKYCWSLFFTPEYCKIDDQLYLEDGTKAYFPLYFQVIPDIGKKCPWCKIPFVADKVRDYFDHPRA